MDVCALFSVVIVVGGRKRGKERKEKDAVVSRGLDTPPPSERIFLLFFLPHTHASDLAHQ